MQKMADRFRVEAAKADDRIGRLLVRMWYAEVVRLRDEEKGQRMLKEAFWAWRSWAVEQEPARLKKDDETKRRGALMRKELIRVLQGRAQEDAGLP